MLAAGVLVAALSAPAMAQTTIVTTTTTERVERPLSLAPQQRTRIKEYVVRQRVPAMQERVVVDQPLPQEVELQAVPQEWGPQVRQYRYVYADDQVMFVDPSTRRVVEVVE
jgi:hypothetical protein